MSLKQGTLPVKKNDDITLYIDTLTSEGHGIGRVDGYAVFVPGALPGETVFAHIIKVNPGYAIAKLTSVTVESGHRVDPVCPVNAQCGGCTLQHLRYEEQLHVKQQTVFDALSRLGGIAEPPVEAIRGMEVPFRYRNKGSFPFSMVNGRVEFGFYAQKSHRLVPCSDCIIEDERIISVVRRVRDWAEAEHISVYNEETGKGLLRHVMVRVTTTGEIMAVIVTAGNSIPHTDTLCDALSDVDSLWHNINTDRSNVIFGRRFVLLSGAEALCDSILGYRFMVNPQSFLQVNPLQTQVLYREAIRLLNACLSETIVDAYCGVGTISLAVSANAGRVIGIETVPEAIDNAKSNAELNGVTNTEFICGDVEHVLPGMTQKIDGIVIDPPRKGCDEHVLVAIAEKNIPRVVYVSCNPATLARDCKYLVASGYRLETAIPVDMFPHTSHVETVCLLSKKNS